MENEKQTSRLEAFSDGIFGVAITLLAIEIDIKPYPNATNVSLWHRIMETWPEYMSYFASFSLVFLIWTGHNRIIHMLRIPSNNIHIVNGLCLLLVALFPYPNRVVGQFLGTNAEATAVAFYLGYSCLINLSMASLTWTILQDESRLVDARKNIPLYKRFLAAQWTGSLCYALISINSLFFPKFSLLLSILMWGYWPTAVKNA